MENTSQNYSDLEFLANLMDDRFEIFGFRFGLSFLIDLIPGIGDMISSLIALYIFFAALRHKVSRWAVFRMIWNILIYFIIGLIPWAGDFFQAWWKPNRRNLRLLQNELNK